MLTVQQQFRQFCRLVVADRLFGDELTAYFEHESRDRLSENGNYEGGRAELLRAFLTDWGRHYDADKTPEPFTTAAMLRGAGPPPPKTQVAVLLNDVLGFTKDEINRVIEPTSNSVTELIVTGRVMHASTAKGSVVIIEDEALIASDLSMIVGGLGAKVVGSAKNAKEASSLILKYQPDLIFADFNLEDEKTGVDVVQESRAYHQCPVVFVTGFPEDVLSGSEREPDVVIGKPYSVESIRAAAAHCLSLPPIRHADVG